MFKLQRLEITGFKSFADYTEIVFTGNGITAVVGPNGCGKSNVSDAMAWVLGEQRARSLRGGEMKDVIFAGTKNRKPGGMAEVVLHLVKDDSSFDVDDTELDDIDKALSGIDEAAVDLENIESEEPETDDPISELSIEENGFAEDAGLEAETVKAAVVGSAQIVETRVKTKRHWRPRSFALDFAPGEAVSVTRRLYLSGESEYQLNGRTCRLRDISDLFAGTGLSGAHYAIIEQGRIGQILSAKPADRRSLIEEAAGISKFRARQRAAESRLDTAKTNLNRIFDIISEVDTRVNSLRRQASKTRRFKILQEEFRQLLRQLYAAEGRYLSDLSEDLDRQLASAGETEKALEAEVADKEEETRVSTFQARAGEESLAELRKIHANNALERDRAEREHLYKSDQIVNLNNRSETLRGAIGAIRQRLELLSGELERLRQIEQHETSEHAKAESALRESEESQRREADALALIETSIDSLRGELLRHTAAAERFDEIARQLDHNLERLSVRAAGLENEGKRAETTFEANRKSFAELATSLEADEKKLAELNKEKDQLMGINVDARNLLRNVESELQSLQDEHSAKRHRLATLQELEEKKAVYAPQIQKLFASVNEIGVKLGGVLADKLNVKKEAEAAVEALFGPLLEAVIVESLDDAKKVSAWLNEKEIGRTAMLIMPEGVETDVPTNDAGSSIAGILGISGKLETALRNILPREMSAHFVDDFDLDNKDRGAVLVNYKGDLLLGGRLLIGGTRKSSGANESLLAFNRELRQLEKDVFTLSAEIGKVAADVDDARGSLVDGESKMVDLQSLIIKVDRGIHGLQIQVRSAREEIDRSERHRKVIAEEAEQLSAEISQAENDRVEALRGKSAAETERATAAASLETFNFQLGEARARAESATTILNEKRMIAATSDERRRSAVSALRRVENEVGDLESRLKIQLLELKESDSRIAALHNEISVITDRIASAGDEIEREGAEINEATDLLASARALADKASEDLATLNHRAAEARNLRAEIEICQAEATTELKNLGENCLQELSSEIRDLIRSVEPDSEFDLETARREAEDARKRLEGFGAINMLALEELAEAEERQLFLTSQREDIINSIAATEEALREIKQRSRDRFRTAFDAINANFGVFFQELFGGGRGEMTLMEADDILEAGIEVVAQPPGKRLQNIQLLSGGEKAMTAIALVLAIFKYRPSPFCLLDEVDAPLDDANVGRFAGKIAEMSEKTQFIVITHNKRTMEAARALYGVTMQEPGISKVVSVKFE